MAMEWKRLWHGCGRLFVVLFFILAFAVLANEPVHAAGLLDVIRDVNVPAQCLSPSTNSSSKPDADSDKARMLASLGEAALSGNTHPNYHYEDSDYPTRLTGITLGGTGSDKAKPQQSIASWAYDIEKDRYKWIKTDSVEAGAGAKAESIPIQGSFNLPTAPTKIVGDSEQSEAPHASCEKALPNLDEQ